VSKTKELKKRHVAKRELSRQFWKPSPVRAAHLFSASFKQRPFPCLVSRRPCKARQLAQSLWDGEEFYLQLDAHMRFAPGWDAQLTTWLAAAEHTSPKAVLSTYPGG